MIDDDDTWARLRRSTSLLLGCAAIALQIISLVVGSMLTSRNCGELLWPFWVLLAVAGVSIGLAVAATVLGLRRMRDHDQIGRVAAPLLGVVALTLGGLVFSDVLNGPAVEVCRIATTGAS